MNSNTTKVDNKVFRQGSAADINAALELAISNGWTQYTTKDFEIMVDVAQDFVVCELSGKLVGIGLCTVYPSKTGRSGGFIGMMLTDANHHQQGIGKGIFTRLIQNSINRGEAPKLIATDLGRKLYSKNSFALTKKPILIKLTGPSSPIADIPTNLESTMTNDPIVLAPIDEMAYGMDRKIVLEKLLAEDGAQGVLVYDSNKKLVGYGLGRLRKERQSVWVGPLYATSVDGAKCVVEALQAHFGSLVKTIEIFIRPETDIGKRFHEYLCSHAYKERVTVHDMVHELFKDEDNVKDSYVSILQPSWG